MDIPAGMLLEPPNLPGWENLPIRQLLAERLGKPTVFQNDGNAAAYGEYWTGAGRGAHSLVMFTLGTGIGGGIVIDGWILEGRHSHGAECGHIIIEMDGGRMCSCGKEGHLEAYASATAHGQAGPRGPRPRRHAEPLRRWSRPRRSPAASSPRPPPRATRWPSG